MTSKTITYRGHQIELMRYVAKTSWTGRETPLWNAKVDGAALQAYSSYWRKTALSAAKQEVDRLEMKAFEEKNL